MACEDYIMKKLIFFIAILTTLSSAKEGTLTKIVDGDTLHFQTDNKNYTCKIAYINTPESTINNQLKHDIGACQNISTKLMLSAGESATQHANKLLKVGSSYKYSTYTKNNEQICEISLGNGITFSEKMLLDGYAVLWQVSKKQKEEQNFNSVLNHAKSKNNGLWANKSEKSKAIKCLDKISRQGLRTSKYSLPSK